MFGLREAGVLGASVAVAGGVAYLIWNYASFSGNTKPQPRPAGDDGRVREEGEGEKREEAEEDEAEPSVVAAAKAQQVSEVKRET